MTPDWKDYSREDVENFIAHEHGCTLEQILALDFPPPDYTTPEGAFWAWSTVYEWLGGFHAAIITMERALDPSRKQMDIELLRELIARRERDGDLFCSDD